MGVGVQVVYQAGVNEKLLGDFIRKHNVRDKVFSELFILSSMFSSLLSKGSFLIRLLFFFFFPLSVASKCGFDIEGDFSVTNSAAHIKKYIEHTIERLGFAPDLYYLHRIDPSVLP